MNHHRLASFALDLNRDMSRLMKRRQPGLAMALLLDGRNTNDRKLLESRRKQLQGAVKSAGLTMGAGAAQA